MAFYTQYFRIRLQFLEKSTYLAKQITKQKFVEVIKKRQSWEADIPYIYRTESGQDGYVFSEWSNVWWFDSEIIACVSHSGPVWVIP